MRNIIVLVEQSSTGSSAVVAGGGALRGWLQDGRLRALPKPVIAGVCFSCHQALTQDAFPRSQRRRLRSGGEAQCQACVKAEEVSEERRSKVVSDLYAFGSSWWPAMMTLVGASVVNVCLSGWSSRFLVTIGSLLGVFCLKRWLLRSLGGFEGEPSLESKPLVLIEGAGWERYVDDVWCRSFASLRRNAFSEEQLSRWWDAAITKTQWHQPTLPNGRSLPRSAAWFVRRGCSCSYEYNATAWPAVEVPSWLLEVEDAVWQILSEASGPVERPNSCVANYYADGMESVDWHADNEPLFEGLLGDCRIVSLSLGQTRRFDLRRRRGLSNPCHHPERISIDLEHGDLITMEGCFQKHWYHRVPKAGGVTRPRINLTWRSITRHNVTCPLSRRERRCASIEK
eukprot:symbB.v1.2.029349.t1/scaffold3183.1/size61800/2